MHLVIINTLFGTVEKALVFDTYTSSQELENFITNYKIFDNFVVLAACKDDCAKNLSQKCKMWFSNMGSREIWNLGYHDSFSFVG